MKNRAGLYLLFVILLCLALISLSACLAEETPSATGVPPTATATEEISATETEEKKQESPFKAPDGVQMYCEKGEENGRPDMTHLFTHVRYESFTDEASDLRYHRLWRICLDCGAEVDFGTTRCKTNSHFCEAGCL